MPERCQSGGMAYWFLGCDLFIENKSERRTRSFRLDHPSFESLQGLTIQDIQQTPNQDAILVLLEAAPSGYRTVGNLVCVDRDGAIRWWAELTDTGRDNYTDVTVDDQIRAYSWDGYRCIIDEKNGKIISKVFVK